MSGDTWYPALLGMADQFRYCSWIYLIKYIINTFFVSLFRYFLCSSPLLLYFLCSASCITVFSMFCFLYFLRSASCITVFSMCCFLYFLCSASCIPVFSMFCFPYSLSYIFPHLIHPLPCKIFSLILSFLFLFEHFLWSYPSSSLSNICTYLILPLPCKTFSLILSFPLPFQILSLIISFLFLVKHFLWSYPSSFFLVKYFHLSCPSSSL